MPKMKSKSGAAKRFRALGGGRFKRTHAFLRHILTKKSTKRKRQLRGMDRCRCHQPEVHAQDAALRIRRIEHATR